MSLHCSACDKVMAEYEVRWNEKAGDFEELCNTCYNVAVDTFNALRGVGEDNELRYRGTPSKILVEGMYGTECPDNYMLDEGERIKAAYEYVLELD